MRAFVTMYLAFVAAAAFAGIHLDDIGKGPRLLLSFPPLPLDSGSYERVTAVTVTVTCGYIVGLSTIPGDWWLEMRGPISNVTTLSASAGHGASYLWSLATLNRFIAISPYEKSCFDVSAVVVTESGDKDGGTEHRYSMKELVLEQ